MIGASNRQTLRNLRDAAGLRAQLLVRIPLVGGFNSTPNDAKQFADLLSCLKAGHAVEVLRYHEYGKDKWEKLGKPYQMQNAFVTDEQFDSFCSVVSSGFLELTRT